MTDSLVWLHLSDLHYCHRTDWDARRLIAELRNDLHQLAVDEGLVPDLIFFTGDLAFGEVPDSPIDVQFSGALDVIETLRTTFTPEVPRENVFLVPGNHDVNRSEVGADQTDWLDEHGNEPTVTKLIQSANVQWRRYMDRLANYRKALEERHFTHLLSDSTRLIYGVTRDIRGIRIGIAGFNSAWSCCRDNEKGKLLLGGKWQASDLSNKLQGSDLKLALIHHPGGWFSESEEPAFSRLVERDFDFHLHGHEHDGWVNVSDRGHVRVAAAACYDRSDKENGYNITRLNLTTGEAEIWLRQYDNRGGGWVARPVARHAKDGTWRLPPLSSLKRARAVQEQRESSASAPSAPSAIPMHSDEARGPLTLASNPRESAGGSTPRIPGSVSELLAHLEDTFGFGWERTPSSDSLENALIYWPVRLRAPTCIHAVQCYAAAGLQKLGAEVILWLDDLGNQDYPPPSFMQTAQQWFRRAGGDEEQLKLRLFSDVVKHEPNEAWSIIQSWLASNVYYLDTILKVSKLWPEITDPPSLVSSFTRSRPRRILTPPMVWACLLTLSSESPERSIITLGGRDEEQLWQVARTCNILPHPRVSHLFIPELRRTRSDVQQNIHMADTPLNWTSKQAIRQALLNGVADARGAGPSNLNTMIPWCARGCVFLPSYIKGEAPGLNVNGSRITSLDEIVALDPADMVDPLVEAIARWLL